MWKNLLICITLSPIRCFQQAIVITAIYRMSKEGDNLGAADHNDQWSEFFPVTNSVIILKEKQQSIIIPGYRCTQSHFIFKENLMKKENKRHLYLFWNRNKVKWSSNVLWWQMKPFSNVSPDRHDRKLVRVFVNHPHSPFLPPWRRSCTRHFNVILIIWR